MIAQDTFGIPVQVGDTVCYPKIAKAGTYAELSTGKVLEVEELAEAYGIQRHKLTLDNKDEVMSFNSMLASGQLESNKEEYPEYFI